MYIIAALELSCGWPRENIWVTTNMHMLNTCSIKYAIFVGGCLFLADLCNDRWGIMRPTESLIKFYVLHSKSFAKISELATYSTKPPTIADTSQIYFFFSFISLQQLTHH